MLSLGESDFAPNAGGAASTGTLSTTGARIGCVSAAGPSSLVVALGSSTRSVPDSSRWPHTPQKAPGSPSVAWQFGQDAIPSAA